MENLESRKESIKLINKILLKAGKKYLKYYVINIMRSEKWLNISFARIQYLRLYRSYVIK